MDNYYWIVCFLVISCLVRVYEASAGESDPLYSACVEQCEKTGCIAERCFADCKFSSDGSTSSFNGNSSIQEPHYLLLEQFRCRSDCQYHCMIDREKARVELGLGPAKYHGKWPCQRLYFFEEPVSVAFSALDLVMNFYGWRGFLYLVYCKLPQKHDKKPFYDYTSLWTIYGLLSMNSCFWSAAYYTRDMYSTKLLYCSSGMALLGYSLILAIVRCFSLKDEAARVMVSAPLLSFTATHILFLFNYKIDDEWNMKVFAAFAIMRILTWSIWGCVSEHPSRPKLCIAVAGSILGMVMIMGIYDFPPYKGFVTLNAVRNASAVPLTFIWWSFGKDDAQYMASNLRYKVE